MTYLTHPNKLNRPKSHLQSPNRPRIDGKCAKHVQHFMNHLLKCAKHVQHLMNLLTKTANITIESVILPSKVSNITWFLGLGWQMWRLDKGKHVLARMKAGMWAMMWWWWRRMWANEVMKVEEVGRGWVGIGRGSSCTTTLVFLPSFMACVLKCDAHFHIVLFLRGCWHRKILNILCPNTQSAQNSLSWTNCTTKTPNPKRKSPAIREISTPNVPIKWKLCMANWRIITQISWCKGQITVWSGKCGDYEGMMKDEGRNVVNDVRSCWQEQQWHKDDERCGPGQRWG